jgi:hypothetical protein
VRRFERVQQAVPSRQGVNPFTKKPIVFAGRPERRTRCDLEVEGAEVREYWSWFEGPPVAAEPRPRVHRLPHRERAVADPQEIVEELLHDGFQEIRLDPNEQANHDVPQARPTVATNRSLDQDRRLSEAIVARCRRQGWFGDDMALGFNLRPQPDVVEWTRFRYAPATDAQLAETERLLGFPLPRPLRTIYAEVANGGFGPGYGFVGVIGGAPDSISKTHLADVYRQDRELSRLEEPFQEWPRRVLRVVDWGCAIWSCIDARSGQMLRYEPTSQQDPARDMTAEAECLEEWVERWVRGENLFSMDRARSR